MQKKWGVYKKLHRWPGLILSFILFYYAVSGIFMNHREAFSGMDISRAILPGNYLYQNWNNAALKGSVTIGRDSILVYGNIGIWLTDSAFRSYSSFNEGFPPGSDNRRIFDIRKSDKGNFYAATIFGIYAFNYGGKRWQRLPLPDGNERFNGIEKIGDTIYAISRSFLYKGLDQGVETRFSKIEVQAPAGYIREVTLFQTVWQLHSGEICGLPGKLLVDLLGVLTAFLSVTGIIFFFFPGWIKRRFHRKKVSPKLVSINKWSLKWHNKMGAQTFVLLIILYFTGMFLRPPLLLTIAYATIPPIKYSHLDQPNPWYDKFRDFEYNPQKDLFMVSTLDGMYELDRYRFTTKWVQNQPPVSVMGINTFTILPDGNYFIGSFSGLFLWHPENVEIHNVISGDIYNEVGLTRPIGDYKITGTLTGPKGNLYFVDYTNGIYPLLHKQPFPEMPENIRNASNMSVWNLSLEFHTGRIFEGLMGDFYILLVPLIGLASCIVVLSGYLLWRRKY
jgi:hypothetical protein